MPILRPNLVWVQDCDLAQFGLVPQRVEGALGTAGQVWPTGEVLGSSGLLVLAREPKYDVRQLALTVTHVGDSVASMLAALRDLQAWCGLGPVTLRTAHDPTLVFLGAHRSHQIAPRRRQFRNATVSGTITFDLRNRFAWERVPRRAVGAAGERIPIETGTGPTQLALWLTDATDPQLIQRDAVGQILRQTSLVLAAQGAQDALWMQTPSRSLTVFASGVASPAASTTLTLGHGWMTLDPRQPGRVQFLETTSGRLWVDTRRSWEL